MVGPSLLITPVLHEGKAVVTGYFPSSDGTTWRDWTTGEVRSLQAPSRLVSERVILTISGGQARWKRTG